MDRFRSKHLWPGLQRGKIAMQASEFIDDFIAKLTDWRGAALANIRRIIHEADPAIVEEWKWKGNPVWSRDGIVCVAGAFKDKVKITFYQGAHLADPDKLFNSELEGKQWRAIDIHRDDKINESSLKKLILAAMDYNQAKAKPADKPGGTPGGMKQKPAK
jgi:hypothetical protein